MSRPPSPPFAWRLAPPPDVSETDAAIRMVPLHGRDPRRITVHIDGDRASLGYAIYRSGPDGEWCIEGPMDAERGLARAQVLSLAAGLPIILSRQSDLSHDAASAAEA